MENKVDSTIGGLKRADYLASDSLMVAEQQGEPVAVEGALFIKFAQQAVAPQVEEARKAASAAAESASAAVVSVKRIENMGVEADTLAPGNVATVEKLPGEKNVTLRFGIPRGHDGYTPQKGKDYFDGKSAYQYAVEAGYPGTEEEFTAKLAAQTGIWYVADGGTPSSVDMLVFDGGTPFTTDEIKLDGGTP